MRSGSLSGKCSKKKADEATFMKTSDFDYLLPDDKIAYRPLKDRQNSNLMVLDREEISILDRRFYELPELLREGDLLIFNNTNVIPARLYGKKNSGGHTEILLLERLEGNIWKCLAKKPKEGLAVGFGERLTGKLRCFGSSEWTIEFSEDITTYVNKYGRMPLPPYIKREAEEEDKVTYQTVYAKREGAAAAPTAGLHFTRGLIEEIEKRGVETGHITLHVGLGTFLPVKEENIVDHVMHSEYLEVPERTAALVNKAKKEERRVIAVGTTVVRTLESSVDESGRVKPFSGRTELFITPGFEFKIVDALITNFHLPCSTLLMLVSAFAGKKYIFQAYDYALEKNYRFLSYGDAMIIC
jgi:S-adenosylmethionine:tRNA ribosyltransferase-isomerase